MTGKIMTECRYSEVKSRSSHFHNAYEMLFIREGGAVIEVSGKRYQVGANTLMFFSNLEEHTAKVEQLPYRRYFAKLDPDELNRHLSSPWQLSIFKNRPEGFVHYVGVERYADELDALFQMLLREEQEDQAYSNDLVLSIIQQILILTYRCDPSRFDVYNQEEQMNCAEIQRWIEDNFTKNIQIKDITENFFISSSHFYRSFKRATGYTPKQYLMLNRISYAKELLIHSSLSVSEIARRAGFVDESNFIRYFKQKMGITPNKYRKSMERR